jgi:hypothetical protein
LIDEPVIGPHALPHDLGGDAHHMRVADAPALDNRDDFHPGTELALPRLNAQDAGVGALQQVDDRRRRDGQRAVGGIFDQDAVPRRADFVERRRDARGNLTAGFISNQRDALGSLNRQTDLDRIAGARLKFGRGGTKQGGAHPPYCTFHFSVVTFR